MKRKVLGWLLALLVGGLNAEETVYRYRTSSADAVIHSEVTYSPAGQGYVLKKVDLERNYVYTARLDQTFSSLDYHTVSPEQGIDVRVVLGEKALTGTGKIDHRPLDVSYPRKEAPFKHFFVFQLQPFILSPDETTVFFSLRPDNLEPYEFIARKEGLETIPVAGNAEPAVKVKVALKGILAKWYSSYSWYRASDGILLRQEYRDQRGRPVQVELVGSIGELQQVVETANRFPNRRRLGMLGRWPSD
jgi:hypothetical protein